MAKKFPNNSMNIHAVTPPEANETVFAVLLALSLSHLLNDSIQSLLPSIYPLLKDSYQLSFAQIGLITLVLQCTASLLQPIVGTLTDRYPQPYSLPVGMGVTLIGLVVLAYAHSFHALLGAAALIGIGSSIFHPESSRLARLASGGRHGFSQSFFQVGGSLGTSLGPLAAAWIIAPHGQRYVLWFTLLALAGILILWRIGVWHQFHLNHANSTHVTVPSKSATMLAPSRVAMALMILAALIFSKYFYMACFTNYYTFYLMACFGVTVEHAQVLLFVFLFAVAVGTIMGGTLGDRIGRLRVIWISILGVAPFTLVLPYLGLTATVVLSGVIGLILSSAFSAILVYAQELVPGKVGMISGIFFGLAFGMAGMGSAFLGKLADHTGIAFVFTACGFLPLIGLLTIFLPDVEHKRDHR